MRTINHHELQPGNWIFFAHPVNPIVDAMGQPFKVLSRNDYEGDRGVCWLMSKGGALHHYDPKAPSISLMPLSSKHVIQRLSHQEAVAYFGKEFEKVERLASFVLGTLILECGDVDKVYDPSRRGKVLSKEKAIERYGVIEPCSVKQRYSSLELFPSFSTPHYVH